MGEDVEPSVYDNKVETVSISNANSGGVLMNKGAYDNIVGGTGGVTCVNCGSDSSLQWLGSVSINNRSDDNNTPPHGNQVLGLNQSGTTNVPEYSVNLGSGTTDNTITGKTTAWSVSKVNDQGSGNIVNLQ
jgi:hypothetical protein